MQLERRIASRLWAPERYFITSKQMLVSSASKTAFTDYPLVLGSQIFPEIKATDSKRVSEKKSKRTLTVAYFAEDCDTSRFIVAVDTEAWHWQEQQEHWLREEDRILAKLRTTDKQYVKQLGHIKKIIKPDRQSLPFNTQASKKETITCPTIYLIAIDGAIDVLPVAPPSLGLEPPARIAEERGDLVDRTKLFVAGSSRSGLAGELEKLPESDNIFTIKSTIESASRMRIFTLADGGAPVVTDTGLIVGVLAEGTPDGLEGTCYSIFYITKRVADEVGIKPLVLPSPLLGLKEGTNK